MIFFYSVRLFFWEETENTKLIWNDTIPLSTWKTGFKQAVQNNIEKLSAFQNNLD